MFSSLLRTVFCTLCCLVALMVVHAVDLTNGLMMAVPTPEGKAPAIDGNLQDWDMSAAEPIWIAPESASMYHASLVMMYDEDALYVGVQASLPNRPLKNTYTPLDGFWWGDCMQLRLVADPQLPWPAGKGGAFTDNTRVAHLTFWKYTETKEDFLQITYGVDLNKGAALNPAGSKTVITTTGQTGYTMESRIPWSALNVPGGKNPFAPGQRMTGIFEILWGGDAYRVASIYAQNPGVFAFQNPGTWGQIEFSPKGNLAPRHQTMEQALAALVPKPVGVPITFDLPKEMKVSVNILGPNGEVLRELIGGETRPAGKITVFWDGRDQWGAPLAPGSYQWGAYLSNGLRAEFMGTVGVSGSPSYETEDGTGAWGADHGDAVDVAADATGMYFLWVVAEEGRAVVKTDYAGKVIWRKTPFLGGGFGPFYAIATNGKYLYLTYGLDKPRLAKLEAATGRLLAFSDSNTVEISDEKATKMPFDTVPLQPSECTGMACDSTTVYVSAYAKNTIRLFDAETGRWLRDIPCPGPRGIALDANGDLYAVSYITGQAPSVVVFRKATLPAVPVITTNLLAPWDVAVDAAGRLHVSDQMESQQVKVFSSTGKLLRTVGKAGGRPWAGKYNGKALLHPAGVAADAQGGVLVAESTIPKVMSRYNASSGKLLQRWYGDRSYATTNIPDPHDPWTQYYSLEGGAPFGFARARVAGEGGSGNPDAYWCLPQIGYPQVDTLLDTMNVPLCFYAKNGKQYMVSDSSPHGICLIKGNTFTPVGFARVTNSQTEKNGVELWSDLNGDGKVQPNELVMLSTIDGKPAPQFASQTGSLWMTETGDMYLVSESNSIVKIPATGFTKQGAILWDVTKASYVVPVVLPGTDKIFTGWRAGILGVRTDAEQNVYVCFNTVAPYATPELTKAMQEGLGHAAEFNTVKFAKYGPDGKMLWMTGRKATGPAKPGEMYHFWVLGGLVNDRYIVGASEWGNMYIYTEDGYFVDTLFDVAGMGSGKPPYTFGSETFAGRIQYFPGLNQVWAYSCGKSFKVRGFNHGMVDGEKRISGTVMLDKVYDLASANTKAEPLQIVALANEKELDNAPKSTLHIGDKQLASAQLGYDTDFLYARIHVIDDSPLKNSADDARMAFKGGDCVGLDLGPAGTRTTPGAGDIRLLAAQVGGQPRLIALKTTTKLAKNPNIYKSPVGQVDYEFAGEVPGGKVTLIPDADGHGYTANLAVPRSFLEISLQPGAVLAGDIEVLLSGQGARGLQVVSRNYLFTPHTSETTMTDDLPSEARMYPQYWGTIQVK